jgi:hypothetical protein
MTPQQRTRSDTVLTLRWMEVIAVLVSKLSLHEVVPMAPAPRVGRRRGRA